MGNTISSQPARVPSLTPTLQSDLIVYRTMNISAGVPLKHRRVLIVISDQSTMRTNLGYAGRRFCDITHEVGDLQQINFSVQHELNQKTSPRVVIGDARWAGQDVRLSGYRRWNWL